MPWIKNIPLCQRTGIKHILAGTSKSFMSYLGHREGSKDTSWKYAHYDGRTSSIPAAATTDVLNYIWDSFGKEQKKTFWKRIWC